MKTMLEKARAGRPLGLTPCIDMHGHIGRYNFPIPDFSGAGLVRAMNRVGVQKIMVSHINCLSFDAHWDNDVVAREMQKFPRRIEGYIGVWPD